MHEDLVQVEAKEKRIAGAADISDDSNKRPARDGDVPSKKRHKRHASNEEARSVGQDENPSVRNVHEIANESSDSSSSSETGEEDQSDAKADGSAYQEIIEELRSHWDSLLDERQEMESKDEISAWLDRVVETSEQFKRACRRSKKMVKLNDLMP